MFLNPRITVTCVILQGIPGFLVISVNMSHVTMCCMFQTIALHSEMMKKSRVDSWDVNTVLMLSDTSPVVGTSSSHYVAVGDEKLCCQMVRQ